MQTPLTIPDLTPTELARFWGKITKTATCWVWTGAKSKGYGVFSITRQTSKTYKATRVMLALNGLRSSLEVCHTCNNPACVNPEHIRFGTRHENCADRIPAGVSNRGSRHGMSKLTEQDVIEMRGLREAHILRGVYTYKEIAHKFGISETAAYNIINRHRWGHL